MTNRANGFILCVAALVLAAVAVAGTPAPAELRRAVGILFVTVMNFPVLVPRLGFLAGFRRPVPGLFTLCSVLAVVLTVMSATFDSISVFAVTAVMSAATGALLLRVLAGSSKP